MKSNNLEKRSSLRDQSRSSDSTNNNQSTTIFKCVNISGISRSPSKSEESSDLMGLILKGNEFTGFKLIGKNHSIDREHDLWMFGHRLVRVLHQFTMQVRRGNRALGDGEFTLCDKALKAFVQLCHKHHEAVPVFVFTKLSDEDIENKVPEHYQPWEFKTQTKSVESFKESYDYLVNWADDFLKNSKQLQSMAVKKAQKEVNLPVSEGIVVEDEDSQPSKRFSTPEKSYKNQKTKSVTKTQTKPQLGEKRPYSKASLSNKAVREPTPQKVDRMIDSDNDELNMAAPSQGTAKFGSSPKNSRNPPSNGKALPVNSDPKTIQKVVKIQDSADSLSAKKRQFQIQKQQKVIEYAKAEAQRQAQATKIGATKAASAKQTTAEFVDKMKRERDEKAKQEAIKKFEAQRQAIAKAQKQKAEEAQAAEAAEKQRQIDAQKAEAKALRDKSLEAAEKRRRAEREEADAQAKRQAEAEAQRQAKLQKFLQAQQELKEAEEAQEAEAKKAREAEVKKAQEAEAKKAQEAEAKKAQEAEAKKAREAEVKKAREAEMRVNLAREAKEKAEAEAQAQLLKRVQKESATNQRQVEEKMRQQISQMENQFGAGGMSSNLEAPSGQGLMAGSASNLNRDVPQRLAPNDSQQRRINFSSQDNMRRGRQLDVKRMLDHVSQKASESLEPRIREIHDDMQEGFGQLRSRSEAQERNIQRIADENATSSQQIVILLQQQQRDQRRIMDTLTNIQQRIDRQERREDERDRVSSQFQYFPDEWYKPNLPEQPNAPNPQSQRSSIQHQSQIQEDQNASASNSIQMPRRKDDDKDNDGQGNDSQALM